MKFKPVVFLAENNFDREANSDSCCIRDFGPSLTVQSMAEENDVAKLMERYQMTGELPQRPVMYGDFDEVMDYRSAMDAINAADEAFMALDPKVRFRFGNDPQQFLEFCSDAQNLDEMRKMGLAKPLPAAQAASGAAIATPPATPVAAPPTAGAAAAPVAPAPVVT